MKDHKSLFLSIRQVLTDGVSVGEVRTAMEQAGFFMLDGYGRFQHVALGQTDRDEEEAAGALEELLHQWSVESEEATINGGYDDSDLVNSGETRLDSCGWMSECVPDFDAIQRRWYLNQTKHAGLTSQAEIEPGGQSKLWCLLDVLMKEWLGPNTVEDLKSAYSLHASGVCKKLEKKGLKISERTLKGYLQKAG